MQRPWKYKKGELLFDGISLKKIEERFKTPFYLYSESHFQEQLKLFKNEALNADIPNPMVCFALKANPNPHLLKQVAKEKAGADVVSGGELKRAIESGISPQRIVFSGVGKTQDEIDLGLNCHPQGIYSFNVESIEELKMINQRAKLFNKKASIAFRLNPQVSAKTHKHISTGFKTHKFGLLKEDIITSIRQKSLWTQAQLQGLSIHIGSQLTCLKATKKAFLELSKLTKELPHPLRFLDIGGGLGVDYSKKEELASLCEYMQLAQSSLLKKMSYRPESIVFEPGRFIAARSGLLVMKVIRTKKSQDCRFVIVDGGMNDFVRTSLYGAHHELLPFKKGSAKKYKTDVVGPICETADCFATGRELPALKSGDLLSVADVGAYGFSMASQYNLRNLPSEIVVTKKGVLKKTKS